MYPSKLPPPLPENAVLAQGGARAYVRCTQRSNLIAVVQYPDDQ